MPRSITLVASRIIMKPKQHRLQCTPKLRPYCRPLGGDECRAEVRWVRAKLFNRRPQAGTDGQEAADGGKCDGGAAGGPGRDRYTVQRSLRWLSRTDVRWGRFCSTAPGRIPRPSPHSFPSWARRSVGAECRACAMGSGRSLSNFGPSIKMMRYRWGGKRMRGRRAGKGVR